MKKRILIFVLLSAAVFAGCAGKSVTAPPLRDPVDIRQDKVAAYIGDIYNVEQFDSAVVPYVQELSFEMDGTVKNVHFYPGMEVKKGDLLVELDMSEAQTQAQHLKDALEHDKKTAAYEDTAAQLDVQLLNVELKQLQEQGASANEIKLKENEIARKQAALRQARQLRELDMRAKEEELKKLAKSLEKDALYAPFSGQILYSDALSTGAQVKAYDPVVFLADNTKLQLCGEYIKPIHLERADLVVAHIGDTRYEITEVAMEEEQNAALAAGTDPETRFVFQTSESLEGQVEAGEYAAILVYTEYIRDALLIPRDAVQKDTVGSYVYVEEGDSRVRRDVKLGKVTDGLAQITAGLQEGEVVYVG